MKIYIFFFCKYIKTSGGEFYNTAELMDKIKTL